MKRLTAHGEVTVGQLYDPPFTGVHHEGLDGAFARSEDADALTEALQATQQLVA